MSHSPLLNLPGPSQELLDEIDSALAYIGSLEGKQLGKPDAHIIAWQSLCHVLIATNEFLYLN